MRIKFIKIDEGEVKRRNKAAKKAWEEKQGKRTEGHRGTFVTAAQKQVAKGADKSTQAGVKAGYRGVARAAEYDKPGPHKGNLAGDYAKEFGSPNAAMRHGRKGGKLRHDSSTEILGDKIVEGIFDFMRAARRSASDPMGDRFRNMATQRRVARGEYDKITEPARSKANAQQRRSQQVLDKTKDFGGKPNPSYHYTNDAFDRNDVEAKDSQWGYGKDVPLGMEGKPGAVHNWTSDDARNRSFQKWQDQKDNSERKMAGIENLGKEYGDAAAQTRSRRQDIRDKFLSSSNPIGRAISKGFGAAKKAFGFKPKSGGRGLGSFMRYRSSIPMPSIPREYRESMERFGYAICESFNNLLNEYRGKHSGYKKGEAPARGSEEAKTVAKRTRFERGAAEAGSKDPNLAKSRLRMVATGKYPDGAPASLEDKKQMGRIVARTGKVAKRAGEKPVSREGAGVRSREENNQRNKKEESLDYTHNDRFDEISHKLKQRAAKAAEKKAKEHAKIADAAKKVGARDTEVIHDKISRSKTTQADKFKGNTGGEDKRGKQQYHQAKKEAGIGTRIVPVSKR